MSMTNKMIIYVKIQPVLIAFIQSKRDQIMDTEKKNKNINGVCMYVENSKMKN